jgi:hypothetical protein
LVTVNVFETKIDGCEADTVCSPGVDGGTEKVNEKSPLLSVVSVPESESNFIVTSVLGIKPVPVTVSVVLTGPDVGFIIIAAEVVAPDVEKFH